MDGWWPVHPMLLLLLPHESRTSLLSWCLAAWLLVGSPNWFMGKNSGTPPSRPSSFLYPSMRFHVFRVEYGSPAPCCRVFKALCSCSCSSHHHCIWPFAHPHGRTKDPEPTAWWWTILLLLSFPRSGGHVSRSFPQWNPGVPVFKGADQDTKTLAHAAMGFWP